MANCARITAPGVVMDTKWCPPGTTLAELQDLCGWHPDTAYILVVNDLPVLREAWATTALAENDNAILLELPGRGGNNKSIIGLVAMIGIAAIAPMVGSWGAAALLGPTAQLTATGVATFKIAAAVIGGVFAAGAGYLLSSFMAPKPPDAGGSGKSMYTLSASGNAARLLQTIPVQYGRVRSAPDYAANSWSEYAANDQYLNLLFSQGAGKFSLERIEIDDTTLWTLADGLSDQFEDVEIQICDPGEAVTLFPTNVQTSVEVTGQELPGDQGWIGGFVANEAGTLTNAIALDIAFPGGIYGTNDEGGKTARTLGLFAQYRAVDSVGAPTGDWMPLWDETKAWKQVDPYRFSVKIPVTQGRYEVRMRRDREHLSNGIDRAVWGGLRAFIVDADNVYEDISVVAVRMKATEQLSEYSSKRFFFTQTRIIPVWDEMEADFVEQPSRDIAWAVWDAATNPLYGGRIDAGRLDFDKLLDLHDTWTSRGDKFDHIFNDATTLWDALSLILKCGRARPITVADKITFVRDEPRTIYRSTITDREMLKGSLSIDYVLQTDEAPDYVIVEYLDETVWKMSEVECKLPGAETPSRPARVQLPGVVQRAHAYREGMYMAADNSLRRQFVTLDTELDGRILRVGDLVKVTSEIPTTWGQSEEIVGLSGAQDNEFHVRNDIDWSESGTKYGIIQTRDHKAFGPFTVVEGSTPSIVYADPDDLDEIEGTLGITRDQALYRDDGEVPPRIMIGTAESLGRDCLVVSGEGQGITTKLALVVDDPAVYTADGGSPPAAPSTPVLVTPQAPVITGLNAIVELNAVEPILRANWNASPGATRYVAQISYDVGETWATVFDGPQTTVQVPVQPNDTLHFRVRAFGLVTGPWVMVELDTPEAVLPDTEVDYGNSDAAMQDIMNRMNALSSQLGGLIQQLGASAASEAATAWLQRQVIRTQVRVQTSQAVAAVSQALVAALDEDESIAGIIEQIENLFTPTDASQLSAFANAQRSLVTRVSTNETSFAEAIDEIQAGVGNLLANGLMRMTVISDGLPSGTAARISFEVRAGTEDDFAEAGFFLDALATGESRIWARADKFVIGDEDNEIAEAGFIFEGGVLKLNVANIGTVTAGILKSSDDLFVIDLANKRWEVSDG